MPMTTTPSLRLKDKIALVTGASRGIGAAVAKCFAREGAHVILVARTISGLEAVDDEIQKAGGSATLVPFDLLHYNKIDELGSIIFERFKRLDILAGIAGIAGALTPVGHINPEIFDKVMGVNCTANLRLIRSMDALLKASPAGRAMFITSGLTQDIQPYWGTYATGKAALEVVVETYAAETKGTNLRVNLVDPGHVATRMRAQLMPGENPATLRQPEEVAEHFVDLAAEECVLHGQRVKI